MVKAITFRRRHAFLLSLTLLTGCPGHGDYIR
ncbi:type VI secretion protein, partial [Enterobacter cloacae complex sp. 742-ADZ3-9B]